MRLPRVAHAALRHATVLLVALVPLACSSMSSSGGADAGAPDGATPSGDAGALACTASGGPVSGAADAHCALGDGGAKAQSVGACLQAHGGDAGHDEDAGDHDPDAGEEDDHYGPTMAGAEGDDDECKYHVKWSAQNVCANADATFTLDVTKLADGAKLRGAPIRFEVFLDETHPAPNAPTTSVEGPDGTYKVGPVRFDKPGKWTVRFHFHEECLDTVEDSPHGHAAFFVSVP